MIRKTMVNNFDQTELENSVGDVIRGLGVSGNVFPNRPYSSRKDLKDFVVCKVSGGIGDLRALGRCVISVQLFAMDAANAKNGRRLSVMQERLVKGMPRQVGRLFILGNPRVIGDTPDGNGYHARIINYQAIIKVTE